MNDMQKDSLYWLLWKLFDSLRRILFGVILVSFILYNNIYAIPTYFCYLMVFSPIHLVHPRLFSHIEGVLFRWIVSSISVWININGYNVEESGDKIESIMDKRFLFMPNHQSTADVPFMIYVFNCHKPVLSGVMWIMDFLFKYTNFGCISYMHDDFFICAGKNTREATLVDLKYHLGNSFIRKKRKCLVLFPEGGFFYKRKASSDRFAEKNNLRKLQNCSLPRMGAFKTVFDTLVDMKRPSTQSEHSIVEDISSTSNLEKCDKLRDSPNWSLDKVVDVTIAYPDGQPLTLLDIVVGWRKSCTVRVHYKIYDISEVISRCENEEGLSQWLYNLYYEKDELLANLYAKNYLTSTGETSRTVNNGQDDKISPETRLLRPDLLRLFFIQAFFYISYCYMTKSVFSLISQSFIFVFNNLFLH